jgi:hypothetical protein
MPEAASEAVKSTVTGDPAATGSAVACDVGAAPSTSVLASAVAGAASSLPAVSSATV